MAEKKVIDNIEKETTAKTKTTKKATTAKKAATTKKEIATKTAKKPVEKVKKETPAKKTVVKKEEQSAPDTAAKKQAAKKVEADNTVKKPAAKKTTTKKETTIRAKKEKVAPVQAVETPQKNRVKILFAASEAMPFVTTGGMGEVIGALPRAIMAENPDEFDMRVIMPYYKNIMTNVKVDYIDSIYINLGWRSQYCGVYTVVSNGVTYYFIDNEYYFKRSSCYGEFDDGERFAFFSKAVLDVMPLIGFVPDILQAHDWQAALSIIYLKTEYKNYELYQNIRSVYTIHNIEYQGKYDISLLENLFGISYYHGGILEFGGCINLTKGAIEAADIVSTVSPTYAGELTDNFFAHGLAPIIDRSRDKLRGILNGIDTVYYDPATDGALYQNYDMDHYEKKAENKKQLQQYLGLDVSADAPLFVMITRLVAHKGVDLMAQIIHSMMDMGAQLVILGQGDGYYENMFSDIQQYYPGKMNAYIDYNRDLAGKLYASGDFFIMPSRSEPCGLAQMIAARYGTPPIVRATGGLLDSIRDCTFGEGNGFVFHDYDSFALLETIKRAMAVYKTPEDYKNLALEAMRSDFSWQRSCKQYMNLYKEMHTW